MNEQPGDVLDEAAKLFDALIRRVAGTGGGAGDHDHDRGRGRGADDDVWGRATAPEPAIATGAPECRDCPVCRAIAVKRQAGGDVGWHLRDAGQSLFAAALDVAAAFDRTGSDRTAGRAARDRPGEASESPPAGRSERSDRPGTGEPWSAATGGDPIDIG